MELGCSLVMLLASSLSLAHGEALSQFIRHYEPLHYDQDNLMYHHHRLRRSIVGPSDISLQFSAFGRFFDLSLKPEKKLFHPNFTLSIDGYPVRNHHFRSFIYQGTARDDPSVTVHGNLMNGVFEGAVFTPDEDYHIEPANRYLQNSSIHSVIYRGSDLDLSTVKGAACGATSENVQQEMLRVQMLQGAEEKRRLRKRQGNPRDSDKVRCWLNVIGDYKYVTSVGGANAAMGQLINIIQQASDIYKNTDFDRNGSPDLIQFGIQELLIEKNPPSSSDPFANEFIGVQSFLDLHSRANYSAFCLSYRFTNRDFEDGVVGLAYVAPQPNQNAAGGICDNVRVQNGVQKTLNTGIVTNLNYQRIIAPRITALTFAHEAGHNFGSDHDTAEPDPVQGAYIMYAFATSGNQPNNDRFSDRSIDTRMFPVIAHAGQDRDNGCFVTADNLCGNRFIDDGEDCDCGGGNELFNNGTCKNDLCCNGANCTLISTAQCSSDQGPCCDNRTCMFLNNVMCSNETECAMEQFCNGTSATCPSPEPRLPPVNETVLLCNSGENVCSNGICSGSICLSLGTNISDCECQTDDQACHVCCNITDVCMSTFDIASTSMGALLPNRTGQYLQIGFPCQEFSGYCDFFNRCMRVDNDGALSRLANFFLNSTGFQQATDWIIRMWWVVLVVTVGVLVIMFVIVVIFHIVLPRPKYRRQGARARKRQPRTVPLQNYPGHSQGYHQYK